MLVRKTSPHRRPQPIESTLSKFAALGVRGQSDTFAVYRPSGLRCGARRCNAVAAQARAPFARLAVTGESNVREDLPAFIADFGDMNAVFSQKLTALRFTEPHENGSVYPICTLVDWLHCFRWLCWNRESVTYKESTGVCGSTPPFRTKRTKFSTHVEQAMKLRLPQSFSGSKSSLLILAFPSATPLRNSSAAIGVAPAFEADPPWSGECEAHLGYLRWG
jgi:hypothetical protein